MITDFLALTDEHHAEEDLINYSQFSQAPTELGYRCIHLLYDETPETLRTMLGSAITPGDAKQLLKYIRKACCDIAIEYQAQNRT